MMKFSFEWNVYSYARSVNGTLPTGDKYEL